MALQDDERTRSLGKPRTPSNEPSERGFCHSLDRDSAALKKRWVSQTTLISSDAGLLPFEYDGRQPITEQSAEDRR
jgi:hypothetical protein